jgi:hypothetical protein
MSAHFVEPILLVGAILLARLTLTSPSGAGRVSPFRSGAQMVLNDLVSLALEPSLEDR